MENGRSGSQPASRLYCFGPGFADMRTAMRDLWLLNAQTAKHYHDKYKTRTLISFSGLFWLVCSLSVAVFGTMLSVMVSALHIIALNVAFVFYYPSWAVIKVADALHLKWSRTSAVCPRCKEKAALPAYVCPGCGARHTDLRPGLYGFLRCKCQCGKKLPATFFNGRHRLEARCPNARCDYPLRGRGSIPVCIPVVGGFSAGKTAFINAFSRQFIEHVAPRKGWKIDFFDRNHEMMYRDIQRDYAAGTVRTTDRPTDRREPSAAAFGFYVGGKGFRQDRLVILYDIAGEVFVKGTEHETQRQLEYCAGIVLVIDPFSIPSVRDARSGKLAKEDPAGIGLEDPVLVVDALINKIGDITGLGIRYGTPVPLAVVIGKTDAAGLHERFGEEEIRKVKQAHPDRHVSDQDAVDYLCRKFLKDHGMGHLLDIINMKFRYNRFFASSSIGHPHGGGEYRPRGVLEPMEWLFGLSDRRFAKTWNDTRFGKKLAT